MNRATYTSATARTASGVALTARTAAGAALQDRYGLKLAARLTEGSADFPHDLAERLRASREQALARRKRPLTAAQSARASASVANSDGSLSLGGGEHMGWWGRLAAGLALVVLVAGLVAIDDVQDDEVAREVASVDTALLTDAVPPSAYADPGFLQFLKHGVPQER